MIKIQHMYLHLRTPRLRNRTGIVTNIRVFSLAYPNHVLEDESILDKLTFDTIRSKLKYVAQIH